MMTKVKLIPFHGEPIYSEIENAYEVNVVIYGDKRPFAYWQREGDVVVFEECSLSFSGVAFVEPV